MKSNIYTKIITICLLLLAILPLGSAFNLTWKELLRLFIITLGLVYLYVIPISADSETVFFWSSQEASLPLVSE